MKPVTVQELTGPNQKYQAYRQAGSALWPAPSRASGRTCSTGTSARRRPTGWPRSSTGRRSARPTTASVPTGPRWTACPTGWSTGSAPSDFSGLHRLEYGLWHGQSAASLVPVVIVLARDVATVQRNLISDDLAGDPTNLPIRAHEILEDALRDHLSGVDDEGSDDAYPETYADLQVDPGRAQ